MKNIICRVQRLMLNNKGFSLTELLVAVVVLGIIVVPMLHTFVTGANTAAKSRKLGDATLAAQNISETIEANDLAQVRKDDCTLFGAESAKMKDGALELYGIEAGTSKFNAKVSFDTTTAFKDINAAELADYPAPDATFVQGDVDDPGNPDKKSETRFDMAKTALTNHGSLKRNVTLTVAYNEGNKITATLLYEYSCDYTAQAINSKGEPVDIGPATWTDSYSYDLFQNGFTVTNDVMPNIYVLYDPWYSKSPSEIQTDSITINNEINKPVSIFLVKQNTTGEDGTKSYKAEILLQQKYENAASIDANLAKVYSNAKEKFGTGTGIVNVNYNILIKGNPLEGGKTITIRVDSLFSGKKEGDLVPKTARNRLFDITIDLYPESETDFTGTALTTLKTSKLQISS